MPDLLHTVYTVTFPDGAQEVRVTKAHQYTYVVVVRRLLGEGWVIKAWHTSLAEAEKDEVWWRESFSKCRSAVIAPTIQQIFRKAEPPTDAALQKRLLTRKVRRLERAAAFYKHSIENMTAHPEDMVAALMTSAANRVDAEALMDQRLTAARKEHDRIVAELELAREARGPIAPRRGGK
jgi:N-glycosylase/DNA lyase